MDACLLLKRKLHREKISFLKERGICFGCLLPGHMRRDYGNRLSCKVCNLNHPTVLHIGKKGTPAGEKSEATKENAKVYSKACWHIGAGEEECVLSTFPVQVKSSKGNQIVQTYAFLDPGSSASFCTNRLMHQLNMTGKKTNILLHTMGQEKTVSSHSVNGL